MRNSAPVIRGSPPLRATVGAEYRFTPMASDADGDRLAFGILNKPSWGVFSTSTGQLSGTPATNAVGVARGVVITVTDGWNTSNLTPFDIEVVDANHGVATLSWIPPTQNIDGTPANDIAGFRVYTGHDPDTLELLREVREPAQSQLTVEGLPAGTHYFAVSVFNSAGGESGRSNIGHKVIL